MKDLVETTGRANLCTAPTLIGIDLNGVPASKQDEIQGDLFELPDIVAKKADCPSAWIRNIEIVNLWAKEQSYNTHGVNYFKMPNGNMVVSIPKKKIVIPAQDELGKTTWNGKKVSMQKAFDEAYLYTLSVIVSAYELVTVLYILPLLCIQILRLYISIINIVPLSVPYFSLYRLLT